MEARKLIRGGAGLGDTGSEKPSADLKTEPMMRDGT